MAALLDKFIRVRPEERGLVFTLGFLLLINALALQVSELVAVSGFLSEVGADELLIVWIVDMTLIILAAGAQSLIVDRFNRVQLLRSMIFAFALIYVVLRLLFAFEAPNWFNYSLMFLLSEQQWLFFPLIFWILANDVYDPAQAKRLFPLIASFSFIGQIISFGIAAAAPAFFQQIGATSAELLNLNVLLYLIAYLVSHRLTKVKVRETRQKHENIRETLTEGWSFIKEVSSFRFLMIAFLLAAIAITIIEYHFFAISSRTITDAGQYQTFYSLVRLAETLIAIAIQAFITGRLIERLGLKNTFVLMPLVVLLCALAIMGMPMLAIISGGWVASRLALNTVDQSARKSLQALVPEERRGRVSVFMDSYLLAAGVILGSALTGIVLIVSRYVQIPTALIYVGLAAIMSVLAVMAILKMRTVYDASLMNWRLKRRQRSASVLDKLNF